MTDTIVIAHESEGLSYEIERFTEGHKAYVVTQTFGRACITPLKCVPLHEALRVVSLHMKQVGATVDIVRQALTSGQMPRAQR